MSLGTFKFTTALVALALGATASLAKDRTLDIGLTDALTGGAAVYGLPQANAVQMAAEEINAAGGILVLKTDDISTAEKEEALKRRELKKAFKEATGEAPPPTVAAPREEKP